MRSGVLPRAQLCDKSALVMNCARAGSGHKAHAAIIANTQERGKPRRVSSDREKPYAINLL
jgi:hypothetical protein